MIKILSYFSILDRLRKYEIKIHRVVESLFCFSLHLVFLSYFVESFY